MKNRFLLLPLGAIAGALTLSSNNAAEDTNTITEFNPDQNKALAWRITNDGVMGGLSKGEVEFADGTMIFSGTLSLENNGGFSTVRSSERLTIDLGESDGIALRAKGDGRTYQLRLSTDARYRGMEASFSADFETQKGKWVEMKVPFDAFKASFRGRSLNDVELEPSKIQRIGILLGDKKPGSFNVTLDWIRPYKGSSEANIVDIVSKDGRFKTLGAALGAAGLVETLQGGGPFTVFAPTDAAFAKLPEGTVEELLKPDNLGKLQSILKYHVVSGSAKLGDALKVSEVGTVEGNSVNVRFADGAVLVNNAKLISADIGTSNGIIHIIDSVLLPPEPKPKTIAQTAAEAGSFKTLLAAVDAAGLTETLESDGPFTVLAPTDEAFAALPKGTLKSLLKPENREKLQSILTYHAIAGRVGAGEALTAGKADTINGAQLQFAISNGKFQVNGATVQTVDIECANGVIHIIDAVLLPPAAEEAKVDAQDSKRQVQVDARREIENAIDRGVPIYNRGDAQACADIYEGCIKAVASSCEADSKLSGALTAVLSRAEHAKDAEARAWMYRHALDATMAYLQHTSQR